MVGGLICLLWCIIALTLTCLVKTPRSSLFPEVDIAAKMGDSLDYTTSRFSHYDSFLEWASSLYNSESSQIRRRLASSKFLVRSSDWEVEEKRPIIVTLQEDELPVTQRHTHYS